MKKILSLALLLIATFCANAQMLDPVKFTHDQFFAVRISQELDRLYVPECEARRIQPKLEFLRIAEDLSAEVGNLGHLDDLFGMYRLEAFCSLLMTL